MARLFRPPWLVDDEPDDRDQPDDGGYALDDPRHPAAPLDVDEPRIDCGAFDEDTEP